MGLNVFEMFAKLSLDSSAFSKALDIAKGDMQAAGKAVSAVGDAVKVTLSGMTSLVENGVKFATETVAGFIKNAAQEVAAYGDAIDKTSQMMGISAQAYQEWDAIMQHSGTDVSVMMQSSKQLANAVQEASDDTVDAFGRIGISIEDAAKMSQEDLFAATVKGLQSMESGTERTALANKLLGRSAMQMGALLNTSAEDTEKMRQRVHELGGVMSDEAVKASAAYTDSLQDMRTAFAGVKRDIGEQLLPSLTAIMDGVSSLVIGEEGANEKISSGVDELALALSGAADGIVEKAQAVFPAIVKAISNNMPKIIQSFAKLFGTFGRAIVDSLPEIAKSAQQIGTTIIKSVTLSIRRFAAALPKTIKELTSTLPQTIQGILPDILEAVDALFNALTEPSVLENAMSAASEIMLALFDGLLKYTDKLMGAATRIVTSLADFLEKNADKIVSSAVSMISQFVTGLVEGDGLGKIADGAIRIVKSLATALTKNDTLENLIGAAAELVGYIVTTATDPETIREITALASSILHSLMDALLSKDTLDAVFNPDTGLPAMLANIIENISTIAVSLIEFAGDLLEKILAYFLDERNWETFKEGAKKILVKLGEAFNAVTGAMDDLLFKLMKAIATMMGANFDGTEAGAEIAEKLAWAIWDNFKKNAFWLPRKIGEWIADLVYSDELEYLAEERGISKASSSHSSTASTGPNKSTSSHSPTASTGNTTADYYMTRGYATGGIVTRPTVSMIGEDGAEAVIPLERNTEWIDRVAERIREQNGGVVIQFGDIYVTGDENVGKQVAEQIDRALRELQIQQARGIGGTAWKR